MKTLHGIPASPGIAIGPAWLYSPDTPAVFPQLSQLTVGEERQRFSQALELAHSQLDALYEKTSREVNPDAAQIFEIHKMMLEDLDYLESIEDHISQLHTAEQAVSVTGQEFAQMLADMDDEVMQARSADVRDITRRLLGILTGQSAQPPLTAPGVVCAWDLFPSDTMQLPRQLVLGFVTEQGSHTSHTAILARTLGIPAVVGVAELTRQQLTGEVIVDGSQGLVILDPDEETMAQYRLAQESYRRQQAELAQYRDQESRTKDGVALEICANIGYPVDADHVVEVNADGIGLMRSEFLYMDSPSAPDEEAQYQAYSQMLRKMAGKRVVIRTLDIGADKVPDWLDLPHEENPALGWRAIRMCLDHQALFRTQLRALLRASVHGRLAIMFPMISRLEELRRAKDLLEDCRRELEQAGVPVSHDIEVGMMIEVPSAALLADQFAPEVDFFSIGTNDLTQYTLAADRLNQKVAGLFDSSHPSVLRLIAHTAASAAAQGIWCGICGESAGDLSLLPFYISVGVRELSVVPGKVWELRRALSQIDSTAPLPNK